MNRQALLHSNSSSSSGNHLDKQGAVELQIRLAKWQLFFLVIIALSLVTVCGLVASMVMPIDQTANTGNDILQNIQNSHIIDNVGLLIQDFWNRQYPNIQQGIALASQLVANANNQNITTVVSQMLSDVKRLGDFANTVINVAANQWVAQNGAP
jgi:hypothetical protein